MSREARSGVRSAARRGRRMGGRAGVRYPPDGPPLARISASIGSSTPMGSFVFSFTSRRAIRNAPVRACHVGRRLESAQSGNVRTDPERPEGPPMADELSTRDAKLIQYLNEAYGKEKELETALQAHIK